MTLFLPILRIFNVDYVGISFDETISRNDLRSLWRAFSGHADEVLKIKELDAEVEECVPEALRRSSDFLTHPVFRSYHCETEMMRYMRRLARQDIALDRSMIPLGSCTMKLNAATELQAL